MKKQTLYLIINALVMVLIGIAVMVVINRAVPQDPEDKLFNQMVELKKLEKLETAEGNSYAIVDTKYKAVDKNDDTVGYVYNVKIQNGFDLSTTDREYGYIELLVGIKDGLVTVEIVTLEQSSSYINGIQRYIYEFYDGVPFLSVENIPSYNAASEEDTAAGSTASTSTSTFQAMVWRSVQYNYGLSMGEPLDDYLGEDYVVEEDNTFTATAHITAKENITTSSLLNDSGYIYTVTGEGPSYDGSIGSITILVIFNSNDEIVGIYAPQESYGHTYSFHSNNLDYLASYAGKTMGDITTVINDNADLETGATYSRTLIDELLGFMVSEVA